MRRDRVTQNSILKEFLKQICTHLIPVYPDLQFILELAVENTHELHQWLFKSDALSVVVALFDIDMAMGSQFYILHCKYG